MPQVDLGDLEPVDYNPFANPSGPLANHAPLPPPQDMTAAARAGKLGTLSAGDQSWGQNLAGGFSNAMGHFGATPTGQKNAYEFGQNLESMIPGVNTAVSGNQAYRDYNQGNYLGALANTAAAVPIPGSSILTGGARRAMMEAGDVGMQDLIRAYHGSRAHFNEFTPENLGIGVEGPGHYFTESQDVAKHYAGPTGNIYSAEIGHDPAKFLDFNAPYSGQHPDVQAALDKVGASKEGTGEDIWRKLVGRTSDEDEWPIAVRDAHDKLQEAGIPGIKYDAYEPEAAGSGAKNYAVFGDGNIKIIGKEPLDGGQ